ncbi:MAG: phosphotransferase [Clostridiales bacterium]|nr:phosphotransferase [Clostridiales bacterium]
MGQAVDRLHALTPRLMAHPVSAAIPKKTLAAELEAIEREAGDWLRVPLFQQVLALLRTALPGLSRPLVFSNGDYNPLNFLAAGGTLSGWIDFEHACYEDPYIGFAKFLLWADDGRWRAGAQSGLVERYLYEHQVAPTEFLARLMLRGLTHVRDCPTARPSAYMLKIVADAAESFRAAT